MKIIERKGDLFAADQTIIGHGVNCQGVMGAGVAAEIKRRYPNVYNSYVSYCSTRTIAELAGKVQVIGIGGGLVANLFTQPTPGPSAECTLIQSSMVALATELSIQFPFGEKEFAIPKIGCGIGGLRWEEVVGTLTGCGWDDFTVYVYSL